MYNYTIDNFWKPLLGYSSEATSSSLVHGWSMETEGPNPFHEAPLTLSTDEFDSDADPTASEIILVSAPGAVGKSTLAEQIAHITGSVYIDLGTAAPVGDNSLSGGLFRSGLSMPWVKGDITVLIDGLDEATLKTKMEAFEAFLADVAEMAKGRPKPTILFGRTSTIEESWLILSDMCEKKIPVLEIGYYGYQESIDYAEVRLKATDPHRQHPDVDREALGLFLDGLRKQTSSDGDSFAGYAPVLNAVAARVKIESNPVQLVSEMKQGGQPPITLQSIVSSILTREQNKLRDLTFQDPSLITQLYSPSEQLDHLVARVYGAPSPELPEMSPEDAETYSAVLDVWVDAHPFLYGNGFSSEVFEASVKAKALMNDTQASKKVLQSELSKGEGANPFLYVFYTGDETKADVRLPAEHIGVFYASLRASLAHGERASLYIEEEDNDNAEELNAIVEIELLRRGFQGPRFVSFDTDVDGNICLGSHVKDVSIIMPQARVEIGQDSDVVFVAPVEILCQDLAIQAERVITENASDSEPDASVVFLQSDISSGPPMSQVPIKRNNVQLLASWPGVENYPWRNYATSPHIYGDEDERLDEALRRLRKFLMVFNGKRGLARSRNKIDSGRMTKGTGQKVLDLMLQEGIVTRDQARYYLHTDRLSELTEMTYVDCVEHNFSASAIELVQRALECEAN